MTRRAKLQPLGSLCGTVARPPPPRTCGPCHAASATPLLLSALHQHRYVLAHFSNCTILLSHTLTMWGTWFCKMFCQQQSVRLRHRQAVVVIRHLVQCLVYCIGYVRTSSILFYWYEGWCVSRCFR